MNNRILKNIISVGIIVITILLLTTISNAASLSISTSKASVLPGETFTVTVTLNDGAGPISASASNGSGSSSQWLENSSLSFSCTAGSSGTVTISASGTVGDFATEKDVNVSKSASVSIVVPTPAPEPKIEPKQPTTNTNTNTQKPKETVTKSNNSKLSKLEIAEGVLSPEFNSNVTEYAINVPNETAKLSILATADSSRATVNIKGNDELQIGENNIEILVTAEDGTTSTYKILATRANPELTLQTLIAYYINENGEQVQLELLPQFSFDIYEYNITNNLPYTVKEIFINTTANRENAVIDIEGNQQLQTGENVITIEVSITDEAGTEEKKTYTITVEKEQEPIPLTPVEKMKNWFNGAGTAISKWITENFNKIITGMLFAATVAFMGLTVYFIYDYKNYKNLLAKLAEYNKANLMERANIALDPELADKKPIEMQENEVQEIVEQQNEEIEEDEEVEVKEKKTKGKRFK